MSDWTINDELNLFYVIKNIEVYRKHRINKTFKADLNEQILTKEFLTRFGELVLIISFKETKRNMFSHWFGWINEIEQQIQEINNSE